MPFYTMKCKKCKEQYDICSLMSERTETIKKAKCPNCNSKNKKEIIGAPSFAFGNPVGTDRYNNSHDYRAKHSIYKPGGAKDQRKMAEAASKVGANPYNRIDDISGGNYFGEVE